MSAPATPDAVVYTDGASRKNPGPAAIGVVVQRADGRELESLGEPIGEATNNEAEYRAVTKGLHLAAKHTAGAVEMRSDSQLLVRQLNGQYKTRKAELIELQRQVRAAEKPFSQVHYRWVPRQDPGLVRADALANEALEAAGHPKSAWRGPSGA